MVRYEPAAEAAQVGGDWYDAFLQRDGAAVVAIGDVVGHDTQAAAAMAQLRNLLRGLAVTSSEGPAGVVRLVDEAVQTLRIETTASVILARFEPAPEEGTAAPGCAGPTPATRPRWPPYRPAGASRSACCGRTSPEVLLGIDPTSPRTESVADLAPGSTLLLYTDGLVERRGRDLDVGVEELREVVRRPARGRPRPRRPLRRAAGPDGPGPPRRRRGAPGRPVEPRPRGSHGRSDCRHAVAPSVRP